MLNKQSEQIDWKDNITRKSISGLHLFMYLIEMAYIGYKPTQKVNPNNVDFFENREQTFSIRIAIDVLQWFFDRTMSRWIRSSSKFSVSNVNPKPTTTQWPTICTRNATLGIFIAWNSWNPTIPQRHVSIWVIWSKMRRSRSRLWLTYLSFSSQDLTNLDAVCVHFWENPAIYASTGLLQKAYST